MKSIRRTLWICPKCKEIRPTRHESVLRHLDRKHGSSEMPISITTLQTRDQMLASGSLTYDRKPFIRTPTTSTQQFSSDSIRRGAHEVRTEIQPDLFDKVSSYALLKMVRETNQKVNYVQNQNATIISILKEIWITISRR